ncbi:MAG: hypothetical protein LBN95_14205 [Prevotellaceae bacterium]|jgi:hypothetical protein|nr:hypothetical protein [Prevotellaceae bacterium]
MKHFLIGFGAGIIVPLLFGWLFMAGFYDGDLTISDALRLMKSTTLLVKLVSVALMPSLCAVFLLNHFEKWNVCRGVMVSIMIYIIVALIM